MLTNARYWTKDYIHLLRGQIVSFLHRSPGPHFNKAGNTDTSPVIIIPGILERWSFMKPLIDAIAENGHDVYVVPKLGNNLMSISRAAAIIDELIQENKLTDVILLAHSKGGLIGKYLLVHHNAERRIRSLIALATPFSGSSRGKYIPHKTLKELQPTSDVIKQLDAHTEVNKNIISIAPIFDNHIVAVAGSTLEGATNITVDVHGHHLVIYDKAVISKILELLKK